MTVNFINNAFDTTIDFPVVNPDVARSMRSFDSAPTRRHAMPRTIAEKRAAFRELHQAGCFVLPNPWDAGSARYLQTLGFKALATTSSGFAWSTGHADNSLPREAILAHLRELVEATDLPVNADFESGFGSNPAEVAESVRLAVETGVAGLSIEDSTGDAAAPLFPLDVAVARMRAARRAIDETGGDTLLVGRAENFVAGRPDLEDAIARLKAYAEAGADCLYAPGIQTREQIEAVVAAVAPKPVNLLLGSSSAFTLQKVAALGVRRISVGGALARAAWGGFIQAAKALADGRFDGFDNAAPGSQLNDLFKDGA
jgi:2-methylisocitrate lyase-like PEP mutase family enzyme